MIWRRLTGLYRSKESTTKKVQQALELLPELILCQACSIFLFDEYGGFLKFFLGTNMKNSVPIPPFRSDAPLWKMFKTDKISKIDENQLGGKFPATDVFFENIPTVKSIAFSPIFDEKNDRIGLVRLLNKINQNGKVCDFEDSDLVAVQTFANALGTIFTTSMLRNKYEEFLDSVTHELLAPISGVKNAGFFIRPIAKRSDTWNKSDLRESLNAKIEDIIRFSEQAITLVQGLTMYTRSAKMSPKDLVLRPSHLFKNIIEKCRGNLTPLLHSRRFRHGSIRCINRSSWPLLKIDRKVFVQVFNNLLANSIKYAYDDPSSFDVTLELDIIQNGDALIVLEDYGIGIQKDEVYKIFDPIFRGKEARNKVPTGTGIGLTTVKNLLGVHECQIDVTNLQTPTQFTVRIPSKFVVGGQHDRFHR